MDADTLTAPGGTPLWLRIGHAQVYDLSVELFAGMPSPRANPPFRLRIARPHGEVVRPGGVSTAVEELSLCCHTGTHLDAIGHVSVDGMLADGSTARAASGSDGLATLGIEGSPPILARGVLLDVAALRPRGVLEPGEEVTVEDLQRAMADPAIEVRPGDVVLIRTGWMRHWTSPDRFLGTGIGTPGLGLAAAKWLADRAVSCVGADTVALEVTRPGEAARPVHGFLVAEHRIGLIEVLDLERLGQDRRAEFTFVALPLKLRGATGSPVRAVAIVEEGGPSGSDASAVR